MRRLLVLCCAVVLVDTAFYSVVAPLLPELEEELGLSKAQAGVLVGAYPAGTLLGALPTGLLAARVGPRRVVVLGLALMATSSLGFAFSDSLVVLDVTRFVSGVGGACSWAGAFAWIVGAAPEARRGELIGTVLAAGIAGALLGPVIGAVAGATSQEAVFGAVAAVGGGLAVLALIEPTRAPRESGQTLRHVGGVLADRRIQAGMGLVALPAICFGLLGTLVPLRLDDLGATQTAIAAVFLVAAALEAAVSPVVGRVSDRRGRLAPIRAGLLAAGLLLLVLPWPAVAAVVAALYVVVTVALGTFWAPSMALLSDAADGAGLAQGPAFALVNLAWAAGQTTGSAAGGAVASATADALPILLAALACFAVLRLSGADRPRRVSAS